MTPAPQPYIANLHLYQPGLPVEQVARQYGLDPHSIVKLASNENPFGMSPKARVAIERALKEGHRYPEPFQLSQALAMRYDIKPAQLVLGNGSNDVLDLIARTFLSPGCESISSQYGFAIYQLITQSAGAINVVVPAKDYGHDLDAMLTAITPQTRVVWIANPNNPTGTFLPYNDIEEFLQQIPTTVVVVLDEAYFEYLAPEKRAETTSWPEKFANLIVIRTFSKMYGLAGERLGFGVASDVVAELINSVRQPFNVNSLALAGALGALEDKPFARSSYAANAEGRTILLKGLQKLGLTCLPAYGNFITFQVPRANTVNEALLRKAIIVRPLHPYNMPNHLRVTIGTAAENHRFLVALTEILAV